MREPPPRFDESEGCPKCGQTVDRLTVEYHMPTMRDFDGEPSGERLVIACQRCGYIYTRSCRSSE